MKVPYFATVSLIVLGLGGGVAAAADDMTPAQDRDVEAVPQMRNYDAGVESQAAPQRAARQGEGQVETGMPQTASTGQPPEGGSTSSREAPETLNEAGSEPFVMPPTGD